jgi:predicted  nucleic acid-binding Zn-ribbon protein
MRYNTSEDWEEIRSKLIGLGEASMRKSYYPELQDRLVELESTITQLEQTQKELRKKVEELEKFSRLTVGRELRIIELKDAVSKLKRELSQCKAKAA